MERVYTERDSKLGIFKSKILRFELNEAFVSGKVLFELEVARVKKSVPWILFSGTRDKFKDGEL